MKYLTYSLISLLTLSSCIFNDAKRPLENPELALQLIQEQKANTSSTLFFQMSDTQFGMASRYLSKFSLGLFPEDFIFPTERKNFESAIQFANQTKPAFVIICGDLVHGPSVHQNQNNEFKRITGLLDASIPLYLVSGNHDVGSFPTPEYLKLYRDTYGADWYSFEEDNVLGIVLNSSLLHNPMDASEDAKNQREWLEEELKLLQTKKNLGKSIIIFQHHPFFRNKIDEEEDPYFTLRSQSRHEYMQLFQKYGVTAVMAGHLHENSEGQFSDIPMITTSAIGIANPFANSRTGFRVVQTGSAGFQHAFIAIQDIPK